MPLDPNDPTDKFVIGVNECAREAFTHNVTRGQIGNIFLGMALRNLRPDMDRPELDATLDKIVALVQTS